MNGSAAECIPKERRLLTDEKPFHILSLDGGGIRGLFSAAVLAHLEHDFQTSIANHFDLIAGTSTGGIIALGLGCGLSPADMVRFYVAHGRQIFANYFGFRTVSQWFVRKYSARPLQSALKDCFRGALLGDSRKRLVIPSYNVGDDDVYIFKTPHHERLRRDYREPMWKVALATTAAPTYFPASRVIDHVRLVDGGVWANNPTIVAIAEAVSMLGVSLDRIRVFSLGTSSPVVRRSALLDSGGRIGWAVSAVDVILRGQSLGANNQAQHLLGLDNQGRSRVLRLDPKVPKNLFSLDKLNDKGLIAKAAVQSRDVSPTFGELFLPHVAADYTPLYVARSSG